MTKPKKPVLIEMDAPVAEGPDRAAPVPDVIPAPGEGRAMRAVIGFGARPRSPLGRFFWATATALIGFIISVAAWRFVEGLLAANPVLGWTAAVLFGLVLLAKFFVPDSLTSDPLFVHVAQVTGEGVGEADERQ